MTQTDCLFCKIISGEIPSKIINDTENFLSFHDVSPQADVHGLVIPKKHISDVIHASNEFSKDLLGDYFVEISNVARKLGLHENGFRVVFNSKSDACQTVFHIHAHILGGNQLSGKMC
ncbi:MAG: histidine triad nucleotide-binding protein [Planctomycetota bacterium]|nr:MAG: histidine triad nucleotide-binding protein [Planctomycetota bacterium]